MTSPARPAADFTLYLVTDPFLGGGADAVPGIVAAAIDGGVSVVQLRDKHCTDGEFIRRAEAVAGAAGTVPVFVNDRVEVACRLGLHLHIGQTDGCYTQIRQKLPAHLLLGLSIDTMGQLDQVIDDCRVNRVALPDVIGIGPVHATSTKPDAAAPLGVAGVAQIARKAARHAIASVAIGGVDEPTAAALGKSGVDGICVVSAIMGAADPRHAAARLRRAFTGGDTAVRSS
nr:thiamine phosphate synthase [Corynebacterium mendelii]